MMKVTFLGTGTSQGIPVIACSCVVCLSKNYKDNRLRSSILIESETTKIVIDTGPDFRQQMLREKVQQLDAVVFTHEHKDHVAGLDDVRAFNFKQQKDMDVFATQQVQETLKREFHYAFAQKKYPGVPLLQLNTIDNVAFDIGDINLLPVNVWHYKMPVKAYRINNFTYITDANRIEEKEIKKIIGTEILVVNALRKEDHISHFNLKEALQLIDRIQPKQAYLTHISHLLGLHDDVLLELPKNVTIAYDSLTITI